MVLGLRQIVVPAQDGLRVVLVANCLQVHVNVREVHSPRAGDSENHRSVSPLLDLNTARLAAPADKHIHQAVHQGRRRARRVQHHPADCEGRFLRVGPRAGDRRAGASFRGPSRPRWDSGKVRIVEHREFYVQVHGLGGQQNLLHQQRGAVRAGHGDIDDGLAANGDHAHVNELYLRKLSRHSQKSVKNPRTILSPYQVN
mmetsp:Transcript_1488/g.3018  ORF Transcript_1488/g.3018 Transcript_1488/m.3018 type:complete len:200 (+) Transcript_1488:2119-2718(+)